MNIKNVYSQLNSQILIIWDKFRQGSSHNIFKFILYSTGCAFCIFVYFQWNKIPVHEHNIVIEHLLTNDTSVCPVPVICLNMNYGSTIDTELPRAKTAFNKCWMDTVNKANRKRVQLKRTKQDLYLLLGSELYNEIEKSWRDSILPGDKIKEIIYLRDTRNVDSYDKVSEHHINSYIYSTRIWGINDSRLDSTPVLKYNKHLYVDDWRVKKGKELKRKYITYSGFILSDKLCYGELEFPDKRNNSFNNMFKMEDISQSYYRLAFTSHSIDSVRLVVDFVGAATFSDMGMKPDIVGMSSFEFNNVFPIPVLSEITFHATFQETQNLQVIRCFFLTALITLLITLAIKSLGGVLSYYIFKKKNI